MGAPWEKYQQLDQVEGAPWEKYQTATTDSPKTNYSLSEVPATALMNAPASGVEFLKRVGQAIAHPIDTAIDTAKGALDIGAGALQKALPQGIVDLINRLDTDPAAAKQAIEVANAAGGYYKERFGSYEAVKRTFAEDPVGAIADLSTLLSGGGALATKAGAVKSGALVSKVGAAIDPMRPVVAGLKYPINAAGTVIDAVKGNIAPLKASKIAKEAAGPQLDAIKNAMVTAPAGITAGQAAADVQRPQFQALAKVLADRDVDNYFYNLAEQQSQAAVNKLATAAGGSTQTATKYSTKAAKKQLQDLTTPMRETELAAANTAGKLLPKLNKEADRFGKAAASKVEDVRRFSAATDRANELSHNWIPVEGMPRAPGRYSREAELAGKAGEVVDQSADASLVMGDAARFAKMRADSLAAHKLKPLDTKAVTSKISKLMDDPRIGVDPLNSRVLGRVNNLIDSWTKKNNGVIDADALNEIRKGAINSVIDDLNPTMDAKLKNKKAAILLSEIRPLIDDAIVAAGGTKWREYLDTFEKGMHGIEQGKLSAKALELYRDSPGKFLKLVEGDNPKLIEKTFGPGSFDIVKEMGEKLKPMEEVAAGLKRTVSMDKQAAAGKEALEIILASNASKIRLPNMLNAKATIANETLKILETKLSTKVKNILEDGFKSAKNMDELLNRLPAKDRVVVLKALGKAREKINPALLTGVGVVSNAMSQQNQNAFVE